MSNMTPISPEQVLSVINNDIEYKNVEWRGLNIVIRPAISFRETSQFINSVMSGCLNNDKDVFVPEAIDFAFRLNTVMRYTNIILPDAIEDQYRILYCTDIYSTVCENINEEQLSSIRYAVEIFVKSLH